MQVQNSSSVFQAKSAVLSQQQAIIPNLTSSVASYVDLSQPLDIRESITAPKAGDIVVAMVERVNPGYPMLETVDSTDVLLEVGDILVGSLGTRKALHGFSGRVPARLEFGQAISLLNKGGVIGECTAFNRELEWPTDLRYLGTVHSDGQPMNLKGSSLQITEEALPNIPLVFVLGTCMNAGKTTACTTVIKNLTKHGTKIHGGKVAGVACKKDLVALQKAGAEKVQSFHDFGYASSADIPSLVPVTRSIIHELAEGNPDCIVLEMGDGIIGGYNVASLFADKELFERQVCMIICANDLMGVWGSLEYLKNVGLSKEENAILVSGPVTDSSEGIKFIENNWNVAAANPFDSPGKLAAFVKGKLPKC